ncbi:tRNA (guanine(9)-N(1))-methyltransferase [Ceratobasidium sp. 414]|nr:tRNA (guanine(9)-N(1))-methyltransferase [Ceratobasidium sp. 414]
MSTDQPLVALSSTPDAAPVEITNTDPTPVLSKSAQKRQAKAERLAQLKLERRAQEKEEKALKRKEREERAAAGEDVGPSDSKKRRVTRGGEGPVLPFNARVVIDLGFDEKMTEKEVGSLCSQLAYTYASHRRTRTPFTGLLFTSLNGRALKHLDGVNDGSYRRWRGAEWWAEDIDGLWNPPAGAEQQAGETATDEPAPANANVDAIPEQVTTDPTFPSTTSNVEPKGDGEPSPGTPAPAPSARGKLRRPRKQQPTQARASCSRESVVYLTADAEDELLELQEGETYIIGGIVDRNRHKASKAVTCSLIDLIQVLFQNLCADKARELNVRSARLPIGRYLANMPTRKVLTVNQVFDILVYWVSTRDWEQAMQKVMPKRKFNANGKKGKVPKDLLAKGLDGNAGDEDESADEPDNSDIQVADTVELDEAAS